MVETEVLLLLESGVAVADAPLLSRFGPAALDNLSNSSLVKPCCARGSGSVPLRVKRSAREAKHLRAPSDT